MYHFRIILVAIAVVFAIAFSVHAEDAPAKPFIPLNTSYKTMQGASMPPHFFPLKGRQLSKFMPHAGSVAAHEKPRETASETAREDDIPMPHKGAPEEMTKDQAHQILSIFGGRE